ncbi:MAG TPA: xanthine dehydrogenase family protein subunit M [Mycobacteriales bacterium]
MIPGPFEYHLATDVEHARRLLREGGEEAKVLAGGMSLIPLMKLRLAQPAVLVDLGRLDHLRDITVADGRIRIGALCRHVDLANSPVVREHLPLLAAVAAEVGDAQVRARGTIGGVLAHADPAGDYCTVARMLDAQIVTTDRRIPVAEFLVDFMTTPLQPDELVVQVDFPVAPGPHAYLKFRRRRSDWAMVGVGVQRTPAGWRIGLTSVGNTVLRADTAEQVLAAGGSLADAAAAAADQARPTDDFVTPAAYKRSLVRTLTTRALSQAGFGTPG